MAQPFRNQNNRYLSVTGTVEEARGQNGRCCSQQIRLRTGMNQTVTVITDPDTCFVDQIQVTRGMIITAFYNANAPTPLIYPPQYRAVVVSQNLLGRTVKVDTFGSGLVSSDNTLRLNLSPQTQIVTKTNQRFTCNLTGQTLVVIYTAGTRSIPVQTTPSKIIVLC